MNTAEFSIKRPVFIFSIFLLSIILGLVSLERLGVDLFPDVNIPVVIVNTVYPGAGAEEVEQLVSRPLEEEISSIAGIDRLSSKNVENLSTVIVKFSLGTDIKWAEQEIRTKVSRTRRLLPSSIEEPLLFRIDPADQPIVRLSLIADLPPAQLHELAKEKIKPRLEQVNNVGLVKILGSTKREIQIVLDRDKLNRYEFSAVAIANQLRNFGVNVPLGKTETGSHETSMRSMGRFRSLSEIEAVPISFSGDPQNSISLSAVASVRDGVEDTTTVAELYGPVASAPEEKTLFQTLFRKSEKKRIKRENHRAVFIDVYKQSGSNTVVTASDSIKRVEAINEQLLQSPGHPRLILVQDGSQWIRYNIDDVSLAIFLGIFLTIIVVYFFLGNVRSTIITGLALPNSLLGAFILMNASGFTINVVTLLALSLTIGLLVDDAIVVRENIFRKLEEGLSSVQAAISGTTEVALAVIATTLTIIAVFLPVGFLGGMVGQFLRQLGFTVIFAMIVSLFDALTMAPLLSAYFAGNVHKSAPNRLIRSFNSLQNRIEEGYAAAMQFALKFPWIIIVSALLLLVLSVLSLKFVKRTFMPPSDQGEFLVALTLPPGYSLEGTHDYTKRIQEKLFAYPEVDKVASVIGTDEGIANVASLLVILVPAHQRERSTQDVKEDMRKMLGRFPEGNPSVNELSKVGGGVQYPMNLFIQGDRLEDMEAYAKKVSAKLKTIKDLTDVDLDYRSGKPEFRIQLDPLKMQRVGVQAGVAGMELRYHVAGEVIGKYYENNLEYDIRLRMDPKERDLKEKYRRTYVPNVQFRMIPLSVISHIEEAFTPESIQRQNRSRTIPIHANLATGGAIGNAVAEAKTILEKELPPPPGITYQFVG